MVKKYLLSKLNLTKKRFKNMSEKIVPTIKKSNTSKSVKKAKSAKSSVKRSKNVKVAKVNKTWLDVPHEKKFFSNDGRVLSNLGELPNALENMSQDTFTHHVNHGKNDFANWADHVMGEQKLAASLRRVKNQTSMTKTVKRLI